MLFKETVLVYYDKNAWNLQIQDAELLTVKVAGTYSYHSDLEG
jgi:hypothetical protein